MAELLFFLLTIISITCAIELPNYIPRCSLSDPKLDDCTLRSTITALPRMVKGDKKYKLPRIEPIKVPEIGITVGDTLNLKMEHVQISGISGSVVKKIAFDFTNNKLSTAFFVPSLNIQADYVINGTILRAPIAGNGLINITMFKVDFTYDFNFDLAEKDTQQYIVPLKPQVTLKSSGGYVDFGQLFSGDSPLGTQVNQFLNDNWEDAENELRSSIEPAIGTIITSLAQKYFDKFSLDDMFLP